MGILKDYFSAYWLEAWDLDPYYPCEPEYVDAAELFSTKRIDLIFRLAYIDSKINHRNMDFAKKLYIESIRILTNNRFAEMGGRAEYKNSIEEYINAFDRMIEKIPKTGLLSEISVVPVSNDNGIIMNGSHRVSIAIYFDLKVPIIRVPFKQGITPDLEFFKVRELNEVYLDYIKEFLMDNGENSLFDRQKVLKRLSMIKKIKHDKKNMNIILSDTELQFRNKQFRYPKTAVAIHLYYDELVEYCCNYIMHIPEWIDVYITTANNDLKQKIRAHLPNSRKVFFLEKENRGRDISALLVAMREKLLQYEYIGFLHDKRAYNDTPKEEIDEWLELIWNNTLSSEAYIYNIIEYLELNDNIGVLVPPLLAEPKLCLLGWDLWCQNFDNTVKLLTELGVHSNINHNVSPICIGTVFWARTAALHKLLQKEWKYNDFDPEPLARDGRLNHAIERCLQYVANDAGYETIFIMSSSYAERRNDRLENMIKRMYNNAVRNTNHNNISYNAFGIQNMKYVFCGDVYTDLEEIKSLKIHNNDSIFINIYKDNVYNLRDAVKFINEKDMSKFIMIFKDDLYYSAIQMFTDNHISIQHIVSLSWLINILKFTNK